MTGGTADDEGRFIVPLFSNEDDVAGAADENEGFEPVVGTEFSAGMTTLMPSSAGNSWRGFVRARAMALPKHYPEKQSRNCLYFGARKQKTV